MDEDGVVCVVWIRLFRKSGDYIEELLRVGAGEVHRILDLLRRAPLEQLADLPLSDCPLYIALHRHLCITRHPSTIRCNPRWEEVLGKTFVRPTTYNHGLLLMEDIIRSEGGDRTEALCARLMSNFKQISEDETVSLAFGLGKALGALLSQAGAGYDHPSCSQQVVGGGYRKTQAEHNMDLAIKVLVLEK